MTKQQLREAIRSIIRQELNENTPAETKPKPGVKDKPATPGKKQPSRPFTKPKGQPGPKAGATMKEANDLAKIIKRFRSQK
jgi:hypothetical protein